MSLQPFTLGDELHVHEQNLPHWRQWGATYFVTSRLADSVPAAVAVDWRRKRDLWLQTRGVRSLEDLSDAQRREYHREFTAGFHTLLDAGHGECLLARAVCADIVIARLTAGHGTAYALDTWCLMPNHLHALVTPGKQVTLGEIVRYRKGGSAFEINKALGRAGRVWQAEPFDHIVRSEAQLEHFRRYIAENPGKAGLHAGYVLGRGAEISSRGL
jgi:REP element-mobilizing transposase RayT